MASVLAGDILFKRPEDVVKKFLALINTSSKWDGFKTGTQNQCPLCTPMTNTFNEKNQANNMIHNILKRGYLIINLPKEIKDPFNVN